MISDSNHPFVSVIIPTYNRWQFLQECLAAVFAQQQVWFDRFDGQDPPASSDYTAEVIVVDDGSTVAPPPTWQLYAQRVRFVRQARRGVSAARNHGIRLARGHWIAFCDSDDLWQPTKLARQLTLMCQTPQATVCYTDEIWIRHGRRVNPKKRHQKFSGWIFEKCLPLCLVSPSAVMMHRRFFEVVGLFDENLPACEDYDLWLRGTLHFPFYFIDEPLIIKRGGHADQLSRRYWGMDRFRVYALAKCLQQSVLSPRQRQLACEMLRAKCRILIQGAEKRGRREAARLYKELSLTLKPDLSIITLH